MSIKMKLLSCLSAFVLMLSIMLVGVYAITHSIKLSGSINFQISDRSLWVKDVRISNDIYTEESIDGFMPGYINGEFNLGIPSIANQYGSFTLYFDIINTTQIPQHVSVDFQNFQYQGLRFQLHQKLQEIMKSLQKYPQQPRLQQHWNLPQKEVATVCEQGLINL